MSEEYGHMLPASILKRIAFSSRKGEAGLVELTFVYEGRQVRDIEFSEPRGASRVGGSYGQYSMSRYPDIERRIGRLETPFGRAIPRLLDGDPLRISEYEDMSGFPLLQQARLDRFIESNSIDVLEDIINGAGRHQVSILAARSEKGKGFACLNGRPALYARAAVDFVPGIEHQPIALEINHLELATIPWSREVMLVFFLDLKRAGTRTFTRTSMKITPRFFFRMFVHAIAEGKNRFIIATEDAKAYRLFLLNLGRESYSQDLFNGGSQASEVSSLLYQANGQDYIPQGIEDVNEVIRLARVGMRENPVNTMIPDSLR